MKIPLLILSLIVAASSVARCQLPSTTATGTSPDANPFEIKDIKRGTNSQVYVDEAWKNNRPVIEVSLRVNEDLGTKKPFIRAYFYDKDKKLINKENVPSEYTEPGNRTVRVPDYLKPKETYKVCFALTDQALDVHRKWSRVLVVFGEGKRAVAEVYPPDDATAFDFAEKDFATAKKK